MGVYLISVRLTGVHLMAVHLMGVHLIDVYFMDVYIYSRSPTLQTVVRAVVDLSRSELQNSVGAAVCLARRTHAFLIGKRQVTPPASDCQE